jgi:hypothetical protein
MIQEYSGLKRFHSTSEVRMDGFASWCFLRRGLEETRETAKVASFFLALMIILFPDWYSFVRHDTKV